MANPEHLELLRQGVEVWNEWRTKEPLVLPDLHEERTSSSIPISLILPALPAIDTLARI
jgi:hypothetical protein